MKLFTPLKYLEREHPELKDLANALKESDYFSLSKKHKVLLLRVTCEELSCTYEAHNLVDMNLGQLNSVKNERKELRKAFEEEKKKHGEVTSRKLLAKEDELNEQEDTSSNIIRMAMLGFDRK